MPGRGRREREGERGGGHGRGRPRGGASIEIASTGNSPELLETIPIVAESGKGRRVVLSFGTGSETDLPLPKIAAGDRLEVLPSSSSRPTPPPPITLASSVTSTTTHPTSRRRCCSPPTAKPQGSSPAARSPSPSRGSMPSATNAITPSSPSATASWRCRRRACRGAGHRSSTSSSAPAIPGQGKATCCWWVKTRRLRRSYRTWRGFALCAFARRRPRHRPHSATPPVCAQACRSQSSRPWSSRTSSPPRPGRAAAGQGSTGHRRCRSRRRGADLDPSLPRHRPRSARIRRQCEGFRNLEGPSVEVHRLQLHSRGGPANLAQVRRGDDPPSAGAESVRQPRRGQRRSVRRHGAHRHPPHRHGEEQARGHPLAGLTICTHTRPDRSDFPAFSCGNSLCSN